MRYESACKEWAKHRSALIMKARLNVRSKMQGTYEVIKHPGIDDETSVSFEDGVRS
jgi:hypothetical protein